MPRGDRTGPAGMGPLTGRGAGYCAGNDAPGYANPMPGRGLGCWGGRGGRGRRNWYHATGLPGRLRVGAAFQAPPVAEEANILREQAGRLRSVLEGIEKRLQELAGGEAE